MKKALALVLALVLALSLGVSAFAETLEVLNLAEAPVYPTSKTPIDTLKLYKNLDGTTKSKTYLAPAEGGDYYFNLAAPAGYTKLKNIVVESINGPMAGSIVKYDADTMSGNDDGVWFLTKNGEKVVDPKKELSEKEYDAYVKVYKDLADLTKSDKYYEFDYYGLVCTEDYEWGKKGQNRPLESEKKYILNDGKTEGKYTELSLFEFYFTSDEAVNTKGEATKGDFDKAVEATITDLTNAVDSNYKYWTIVEFVKLNDTTEAFNKALAKGMRKELNVSIFDASTENDGEPMLKLTIDPNYSASYKTGTFVVKATAVSYGADGKVDDSVKVSYTGKVVSDVVIFEYEQVKYAGKAEVALKVGENGYSAFYYDGVYTKNGTDYNYEDLRKHENATVISTTAFRAIRENEQSISVKAGYMTVDIPEVGTTQKGVNFAYDKGNDWNRISDNGIVKVYNAAYLSKGVKVPEAIEFGFLGDQVIASDFTVTVDLDMNAYELREFFGKAVEEEDIITYYIVENGKVAGQVTYDYMDKESIDDNIELEIKRKAGETLGHYSIVLEAPSAAPEGEENPNTGAESVIGVVAAMAVVSLAAAAAVSLKK